MSLEYLEQGSQQLDSNYKNVVTKHMIPTKMDCVVGTTKKLVVLLM